MKKAYLEGDEKEAFSFRANAHTLPSIITATIIITITMISPSFFSVAPSAPATDL